MARAFRHRSRALDVEYCLASHLSAAERSDCFGNPGPGAPPAHLRIQLAPGDPLEQRGKIPSESAAVRKDIERLDSPAASKTRLLKVDGGWLERSLSNALHAAFGLDQRIGLREQIAANVFEHAVYGRYFAQPNNHFGCAELSKTGAALGFADTSDHVRTGARCELHGHPPDTAAGAGHEDAPAD